MTRSIHLVVLVHGLWGTTAHFNYIASQFEARGATVHDAGTDIHLPALGDKQVVVYRVQSNEGYFTYDGIDVCGTRVVNEIERELEQLAAIGDGWSVTDISIVGYSLGGLISRYAIGLMYKRGLFDNINPVSYTSFCTPHVGTLMLGSRLATRAFNFIATHSMSATSKQLFLADKFQSTGVPLLEYMAQPKSPFYKGLELFPSHVLYANIVNDHRCEYYTAAIEDNDPFKGKAASLTGPYLEGYAPTILDGEPQFDPALTAISTASTSFFGRVATFFHRLARYGGTFFKVVIFVPLWFIAFLINAAYQTVTSASRQHPIRSSGEHIRLLFDDEPVDNSGPNVDEMLEDGADDVVESVYRALNKPGSTGTGTLPFSEAQHNIVSNLNALNWTKHPVHITVGSHAHAAVIVRYPTEKFREGRTIIAQWLEDSKFTPSL